MNTWQSTADHLLRDDAADPHAVRAALEHAALGLLHRPAADDIGAQMSLLEVDQALAELPGQAPIGTTSHPQVAPEENVGVDDVRPLLGHAADALPALAAHAEEAAALAYARTAVLVGQALIALDG